jgi:hypothetical protein
MMSTSKRTFVLFGFPTEWSNFDLGRSSQAILPLGLSLQRSLLSLRPLSRWTGAISTREFPSRQTMLRNHLYEKIMLFLTGAGFGIYLFELRRFYNRVHPPFIDRSARRTETTDAKKQTTTRSV